MTLKRLRTRIGVPAALIAVLVLALPGSALASLGDQEEFFAPTQPTKPLTLVEGSDGNLWYTNDGSTKIGKVTPAGVVTEFEPGLTGAALSITAGPEGKLWFTEKAAKKIGSIKPSEPETSKAECSVPAEAGEPEFIVAGSDGNLWFTTAPTPGSRRVVKMTPACGFTEYVPGTYPGIPSTSVPATIVAGDDGNLYYGTIGATKAIGKITLPAETFTEFTVNSGAGLYNKPQSLVYGGDGRIWFAAENTAGPTPAEERIGAITTDGATTTYYKAGLGDGSGANLIGFALGADGNVWAKEPGPPAERNERQKITLSASASDLGGTYKLKFEGCETAPIAWNASAGTVEAELGACTDGVANVKVIETSTGSNQVIRTIEFEGKFARTDVDMLECISALTGTPPTSCTVEQTTSAIAQRLIRFEPSGAPTVFSLAPRTKLAIPAVIGKMGGLVSGPHNSLWFTTAGDTAFPSTPAIGKFDLGIPTTPQFSLTVNKEGTGDGTVVSNPVGIECDPTCSAEFDEGEEVTLTASPDSESLFVSWKGCDKGGVNGRQCKVTMDKNKTVVAKFITAYDVEVSREGSGLGKVQSTPGGVLCLANCESTSAAFKENTAVTLKAAPSKNFKFVEWTGDCSGSSPECSLGALGADKEVGFEFAEVAKFDLTLSKSGGGQGTVKGKPAGINCGLTCSSQAASYYENAEVELTVTTGKGSSFGGWSTDAGTCTGTTTPCKVTMSSAKALTAEFK